MIYPDLSLQERNFVNLPISLRPSAKYHYVCSNFGHSGFTYAQNASKFVFYRASAYTCRDYRHEIILQPWFAFKGSLGS